VAAHTIWSLAVTLRSLAVTCLLPSARGWVISARGGGGCRLACMQDARSLYGSRKPFRRRRARRLEQCIEEDARADGGGRRRAQDVRGKVSYGSSASCSGATATQGFAAAVGDANSHDADSATQGFAAAVGEAGWETVYRRSRNWRSGKYQSRDRHILRERKGGRGRGAPKRT